MNLNKLFLIVTIIELILYFIIKIIINDSIIKESIALGFIIGNLVFLFVIVPIIIISRKLRKKE
jgi:uncharacterized membrane protein YhaH (DUF805 family)